MRCSNCGSDNSDGLKFCNQCGAALNARCQQCGFDNAPGARFCGQCGAPLTAGAQNRPAMGQPVHAVERPENRFQSRAGERRHLTVLFCDLVGSTEIAARLDPEEWQETVAAYHRAAGDAIGQFGGHVAKYLGDGVMAYFGYPEAHDNDAERAARAGLEILNAISKLNEQPESLPLKGGGPGRVSRPRLAVRVGIDSGAVVVGAGAGMEIDVFGEAPNIAARVQGAAAPDTVLLSAATHRLVAGLFVVEDCGGQALKGVEQPMHLYRVIQPAGVRGRLAAAAASRGLTPFVGREDELRTLTSRWQRVIDGEGQVVLIVGEAGIGKSRLVQQFHQQIAGTPHTWVEAAAAPFYQNTPFYPVAEALWQLVWEQSLNRFGDYLRELQNKGEVYSGNVQSAPPPSPSPVSRNGGGDRDTPSAAGSPPPLFDTGEGSLGGAPAEPSKRVGEVRISSSGGADEKLTQLQSGLISAGLTPAEAIPLIAPLLHLPLSTSYAPSSLSPEQQRRRLLATLIEWLLGAARAQPLVIVIEDLHWADPSTLELIQLLAEQGATARMLLLYTARPEFRTEGPLRAHHTQITLNRLSARNVREMIAQVAARNALANETLEAVVERTSGVPLFVEELTRAVLESADTKLTGRAIPVTLHDSLMARLDRLGSAKEVLQVGSVIGGEFSYELLHAVHSLSDEDLQRELRRLTDADLLYVRGLAPDATYQFKHALIRDAAYEALLKSRRRELHRLVAHTLDEKFPAFKETQPEVLARHWTEAGEAEPAIGAWQRSGERAVERGAFREAEEHYREALAILATLPQTVERDARELALQLALGSVVRATRGFSTAATAEVYARARQLAQLTGDVKSLDIFSAEHSTAHTRGGARRALVLADQMLQIAHGLATPRTLALAHNAQGLPRLYLGDLAGARQHFLLAIEHYREDDFVDFRINPGTGSLTWAGLNEWLFGYPDRATRYTSDAITMARRQNNLFDVALALNVDAQVQSLRGNLKRALENVTEMLMLSEASGFRLWSSIGKIHGTWVRAQIEECENAVELIREGLAELDAMEFYLARARFLGYLAEAQVRAGAVDEALITLEQAVQPNPDSVVYRPEMLRLRGELRFNQGHIDSAEADFRESIELARSMGAKAWELRTAMSLARLLDHQGRRDEARAMLAEIYNWFTEGFDTPDLMDAKVLLIELGA
jgi:class 3 adenylate cyclase/tetratricopeptide (TPR) repeat protein